MPNLNFSSSDDISLFFLSRHSIRSEIYQINQKRLVDSFHRLLGSLRDSYRPITLVLYILDRDLDIIDCGEGVGSFLKFLSEKFRPGICFRKRKKLRRRLKKAKFIYSSTYLLIDSSTHLLIFSSTYSGL